MKARLLRAWLVVPCVLALLEAASGTVTGTVLAVVSVLGAGVARDLFRAGGVL